jgi:hypothetical protein
MVVRLDLHQDVGQLVGRCIDIAGRRATGIEARDSRAFDDRGIVAVGNHGAFGMQRVGVADHGEERFVLRYAVDGPVGVENLVAAVLAVGLREHHQLDIGRVAFGAGEGGVQVIDLVVRQGQAEFGVGRLQRVLAAGQHVDRRQGLRSEGVEQRMRILGAAQHGFGHAVMQQRGDGSDGCIGQLSGSAQDAGLEMHGVRDAALDPVHMRHAAVVRDVGGLAGPGRNGAEARHGHKGFTGRGRAALEGFAVDQQRGQAVDVNLRQRCAGIDEVQIARRDADDVGIDLLQLGQETFGTKGRQGAGARQNQHGERRSRQSRRDGWNGMIVMIAVSMMHRMLRPFALQCGSSGTTVPVGSMTT